MDNATHQEKIQSILSDILGYLDIQYTVEILPLDSSEPNDSEESSATSKYKVNIKSTEDNLLIGYHGNTLNSLQYLMNIFMMREFGAGVNLVIEVGDYRKNREDKLRSLAIDAAERAKELERSVSLPPMSSYERRVVHEVITSIEGVFSHSEGENEFRKVIITLSEAQPDENESDLESDQTSGEDNDTE